MALMPSKDVRKLAADLFQSFDRNKSRIEDLLGAYVEQPSEKYLPFDHFLAVWMDQQINNGTLQPSPATRRTLAQIKHAVGYKPESTLPARFTGGGLREPLVFQET